MKNLSVEELIESVWPGWKLIRKIGKGSFGTVYEIQKVNGNMIDYAALKIISIPEDGTSIPMGKDRQTLYTYYESIADGMAKEYEIMSGLKQAGCENVVACDSYIKVPNKNGIGLKLLIQMELLTDLNTYARRNGFSRQNIIHLGIDMCKALEFCKKAHVIHRDIKPANLFVSTDGVYKLGDFGVAKRLEETGYAGSKQGTILYMAPEVYANKPYDTRADILSLGLVMYQLLNNGELPFDSGEFSEEKQGEAFRKRMRGEKIPMPALGGNVLGKIVCRACEYEYHKRYNTPREMREELEQLLDSQDGEMVLFPVDDVEEEESRSLENAKTLTSKGAQTSDKEVEEPAVVPSKKIFLIIALLLFCIIVGTFAILFNKVFSDSIKPTNDKQLTAVTEDTENLTGKTENQWSEWRVNLPNYVDENNYNIQEKILYSSRERETITSDEEYFDEDWELYEIIEETGEFGEWSDWSTTEVETSDTREVKTEIRYSYKNREKTTSSEYYLEGWELDYVEYSWSDYGKWSDWSEKAAYDSESREVKTKTQYSYRDKWISQEYTDWSSYGEWQDNQESTNDLKQEQSRSVWGYYYFQCPSCGLHTPYWSITCPTYAGGCGKSYISEDSWHAIWNEMSWDEAGLKQWYGAPKHYTYIDGEMYFKWHDNGNRKTQYRYATRSIMDVTNYTEWSAYSDTVYTASSTREVNTRTLYSYRDRQEEATYHYQRWGEWSEWTSEEITENEDLKVETGIFYSYRDKEIKKTYCYQRWGEWSEYKETKVAESEDIQVNEQTHYRFQLKSD